MDILGLLGGSKRSVRRFARQGLRDCRDLIEGLIAQRRLRREIDAALDERAATVIKPLPDFLIIGAPKCATSWLGGALARQPCILMVDDEIEYFTAHLDRPLEWYLSHFEQIDEIKRPGPGAKLVLGEKSAGYSGLSPARIRLVHRLLPNARLILMIRDPVARHWSHAKRFFSKKKAKRRGFESLESRKQLYRLFTRMRRFSEFSKMIENWTDVYPAERLLIVSQEAAFADPVQTFDRVMRHIGAAGPDPPRMKHVLCNDRNQGPVIPMPDDVAVHLERMFAGERLRLQRVLRARFSAEAVSEIGLDQDTAGMPPAKSLSAGVRHSS